MITSVKIPNLSHLLLFLASLPPLLHTVALKEKTPEETLQPQSGTAVQRLTQNSGRSNKSAFMSNPITGPKKDDDVQSLPLSWLSLSPEEIDTQGVIGEYSDLQVGPETSDSYANRMGFATSTDSVAEERSEGVGSSFKNSSPNLQRTIMHQTAKINNKTTALRPTQAGGTQQILSTVENDVNHRSMTTSLQSGSTFPETAQQKSNNLQFPGLDLNSKNPTRATNGLEMKTEVTAPQTLDHDLNRRTAKMAQEEVDSKNDEHRASRTTGTVRLVTSSKTWNQSWTPTDPSDLTPGESLHRSLVHGPALLVPLYSDWNSAFATWGFAWEAHIYGFGSVFAVFFLISVISLLGLPLRCPPGAPYFTFLHLFILSFAGMQAFCLLYDAYSSQDRLPPLVSLLLYELTFPCLISSFSLVFLLLSFRSRMHLSLPLVISAPFSALPKPCVLLCMSLLHFVISLGCVGILQVFPSLPDLILLFPHGVFVCYSTFLSFFFFVFYCLTQVNAKHIYQLDDIGENGERPDIAQVALYPFAIGNDWDRAAAAALVTSLCLLGCGSLQLYGILHATGLGGVEGHGFLPWPWWGYQAGSRFCEAGVCLGLCLIATHPLFCRRNSSSKTISNPRPGSWSRLSCSPPSRGLTLSTQGHINSTIVTSHDSWSTDKQEKLTVCHVVTKGQSESLPLNPRWDSSENGLQKPPQVDTVLPQPTSSSTERPTAELETQSSCLYVLDCDSTVDLRPPSPIDLSRSIDQALFSESLFSQSIFGLSRDNHTSSSLSLNSPGQMSSKQGVGSEGNALYRTSSCGNVDQERKMSVSRPSQPHGHFSSHRNPATSQEQWDWKGSITGSTQGLCTHPKPTQKVRSNSWANRGQHLAQNSLPRAIPRFSYYRRYRTLSLASEDSRACGQLAGTKPLSQSKQLEWDMAVQAEFVKVCRQIDALSICSDTIEL